MSKVNLAKDPYLVTSTAPENTYYKCESNIEKSEQSASRFWDVNDKGSDNGATACTEKPEKVSDIPYEEYMRVIHENNILKQIIIELNVLLFKEK